MSAATVTSSDHPADYLKEGMKWLEQHYIPDTTQRQDAGDCYSCLTPVPRGGEADNRRFCKRRLVSSSANMVGAKADDDLGTVANQHKYRMIAAQLMSNATREADQKTLNEKGLQCTNAYRLSGPLNDDGTCPIQNSTFVTKRSEDDDRYFLWTFDSEARLGKKIIGVPGLRDRLGLPPTPANITAWKKPTGDKISDFDAITNWIRSQIGQEQAFVQGYTDETTAYAGHAGRLRTALRLDSAGNQRAILRAKTTLWGSELNHPVIRQREKYDRKPPGGTFESLASRLVSLAIQSHASQSQTVAKLRSQYSGWSRPICITCKLNPDHTPDSNYSSWAFPVNPEAHPCETLYDYVTFNDGEIQGLVEEITAGQLTGMLSGESRSVTAGSSKRGGEGSSNTRSDKGSKKQRAV